MKSNMMLIFQLDALIRRFGGHAPFELHENEVCIKYWELRTSGVCSFAFELQLRVYL